MATTNEHTGDALISKTTTKAYADGWERIFGKNKKAEEVKEDDKKEEPKGE